MTTTATAVMEMMRTREAVVGGARANRAAEAGTGTDEMEAAAAAATTATGAEGAVATAETGGEAVATTAPTDGAADHGATGVETDAARATKNSAAGMTMDRTPCPATSH